MVPRSRTTSPPSVSVQPWTQGSARSDTADVYANTMAETVLGDALTGERRQSLEIFTKVFGPTPQGDTTMSVSPVNTSLSPWTVP